MSCIKSIQRGTDYTVGKSTTRIGIPTKAVDPNKTVIFVKSTPENYRYMPYDVAVGSLTSSTTLTLSSWLCNGDIGTRNGWQIIEFA